MNVLLSDLRMVQDSGGVTNIASDNKSITVTVPYAFGVFCATASGLTTVNMLPTDSVTLAFATYAGYGWRSPTTGRYTIVPKSGNNPATSTQASKCTGTAAGEAGMKVVSINGRSGLTLDILPVSIASGTRPGLPVMFYQTITYSFAASSMFPGKIGLWRNITGGANEELMAPFATTARFRYYTSGDDTSRTTAPALSDIRGVAIVLTAEASRKPAGRTALSQSKMITSVFFKNTRAP